MPLYGLNDLGLHDARIDHEQTQAMTAVWLAKNLDYIQQ